MIYFNFAGYWPWNSWQGSIWFSAGILFSYLFSFCWSMWCDRKSIRQWYWLAGFLLLLMGTSAAVAGYYSWFAGGRAQFGYCNDGLKKEYNRGFYEGSTNPATRGQAWAECKKCEFEREQCAVSANKLMDAYAKIQRECHGRR